MHNKNVRALGVVAVLTMITALIPCADAHATSIAESVAGAGAGASIDTWYSSDEYKEAAKGVSAYGYTNLGIANVDNHLNIREGAGEDYKIIGKMTLDKDGDWVHIKSGDVEGYCHRDYLLTGELARRRAESVITLEAESTEGGVVVVFPISWEFTHI